MLRREKGCDDVDRHEKAAQKTLEGLHNLA